MELGESGKISEALACIIANTYYRLIGTDALLNTSKEAKAQILANHYEDTCKDIREQIKVRGRMLLCTLVVLWMGVLRMSGNSDSVEVTFLSKYISPPVVIGGDWFNSLLCLIFLCVSTRYFQVNVNINRRYDYVHELEEKFASLLECVLISREGKSYLSGYPWFSDFTHIIYTWVIPVMIFVFSLVSIIRYAITYGSPEQFLEYEQSLVSFILCLVFTTVTAISTLLYVICVNFKK